MKLSGHLRKAISEASNIFRPGSKPGLGNDIISRTSGQMGQFLGRLWTLQKLWKQNISKTFSVRHLLPYLPNASILLGTFRFHFWVQITCLFRRGVRTVTFDQLWAVAARTSRRCRRRYYSYQMPRDTFSNGCKFHWVIFSRFLTVMKYSMKNRHHVDFHHPV